MIKTSESQLKATRNWKKRNYEKAIEIQKNYYEQNKDKIKNYYKRYTKYRYAASVLRMIEY